MAANQCSVSHWDSHDPLLDFFCTITKAFLCWICLGVTHHTYLLTACVVPGSCLILNALHQKHSSPVKQYTCSPRFSSLIHFYPLFTFPLLLGCWGLQLKIIQVFFFNTGSLRRNVEQLKTQHSHCGCPVVKLIHNWTGGVFEKFPMNVVSISRFTFTFTIETTVTLTCICNLYIW